MDLENEAIVNPRESEMTLGFQARIVSLLRLHDINMASFDKLVVGDGVWTLYQYLRGNPEVPWNVLTLLRDWLSVFNETGFDMVESYPLSNGNTQGF